MSKSPKHIRHGFVGINVGSPAQASPQVAVDKRQMTSDMISLEENESRQALKEDLDKAAEAEVEEVKTTKK